MSVQRFKKSITSFTDSPKGIQNSSQFVNKLVFEYDMLVRLGFETTNPQISVISGNTELMRTLLTQQLISNKTATKPIKLVERIGIAIKGYWIGAQLSPFPPPIIPAPGGLTNVVTNSTLVTNTGVFKFPQPQFPVNKSSIFIDQLVLGIRQHLLTISGLYFTTTLYPPTSFPAPGIVPWTGYSIVE